MNEHVYKGYLSAHTGLIRDLHERGASTRVIAEALYAAGARAGTSSPHSHQMNRAAHIVNLRAMTIYIERRLGLRIRRFHILNLTAEKKEVLGLTPGTSHFNNDDDTTMKQGDLIGAPLK